MQIGGKSVFVNKSTNDWKRGCAVFSEKGHVMFKQQKEVPE